MHYTLNSDFLWKEIGRQVVILHFKSGVYWTLNETASLIFKELIENKKTTEEIAQIMVKQYEIEKQQATQDIEEFINECQKKDVLSTDN